MKKIVYIVAAAALFALSCQKEVDQETVAPKNSTYAFKASVQDLNSPTKAEINASHQLVWSSGDKIGIYVNDNWGDKNQPFTLDGDGGSSTGSFNWDYGTFDNANATVAFFPWQGQWKSVTLEDVNNVNTYSTSFRVYYKLPSDYGSDENPTYTSGQMITPLAAKISRTNNEYAPISFKHAGGAVKFTTTNLPAGAHSIKMEAAQQIHGFYHLDYDNIGTSAMVVNSDAENSANNSIWLHFAPANTSRDYTFLFPVPSLAENAKLSFQIYDKNDVLVWSRSVSNHEAINNGDVLLLGGDEPVSIEPYRQFSKASSWYVHATLDGSSWADYPMITDPDESKSIAVDLSFISGGRFKVTDGTNWYPESDWVVNEGEAKDIVFDSSSHDIKVSKNGECPYPSQAHHYTSIKNATPLGATETANCYIITEAGSYSIPVVKGNSSESAGTVGGVQLLWETFNNDVTPEVNEIITSVDWDERDASHIYFKTPATLKPGNALIAAKDAEGNIIWSWHIWIPKDDIKDVGDLKASSKYFMDRNLGALVVTEAKESVVDVQSYGMLYQWGRKDPFGGARAFNSSSRARAAGTVFGDTNRTEDTSFDLEASYAAPTIHANFDGWLKGVEEWNPGGNKSINDPCPPGYKVPDYNSSDAIWGNVGSATDFSASATYGWWKLGKHIFPFAGFAGTGNSIEHAYDRCRLLSNEMQDGYDEHAKAQYLYYENSAWKHDGSTRKRYLASVRCVKIDGDVPASATTPASGFTLDGDMSEWSDGEAISNSGSIKEWKYGADATNLYFYFKIDKTDIKDDNGSYNWKRYIYIALDTDNKTSTGTTYGQAGLSFPGCDALATVYPFRGTVPDGQTYPAGVQFVNGIDEQGETQSPIGTGTGGHVTAFGYISGDYGYLEIGVPRAKIGSPANGKMKVQFSYSWNKTGAQLIEIK